MLATAQPDLSTCIVATKSRHIQTRQQLGTSDLHIRSELLGSTFVYWLTSWLERTLFVEEAHKVP